MDLEPGKVYPIPNLGYGVPSKSIPGVLRVVRGNECSCPAGERGRRCWHLNAVQGYVRDQNVKYKRPVAPPHISALVD